MMMTPTRARAYGRVMRALDDLDPATLHPGEVDQIRTAADTLLFCADLEDEAARVALIEVDSLARNLLTSERLTSRRAHHLLNDVRACGPLKPTLLAEAA
jgi:hypothetical protein